MLCCSYDALSIRVRVDYVSFTCRLRVFVMSLSCLTADRVLIECCYAAMSLFIEAYRAELLLLFAIDITGFVQVGLDLFGIGVEVITQQLQGVKFLVAQQHVDT